MVKASRVAGAMHRTTVNLPVALWIEAKVRAARESKDAQDVLREALEAWLGVKASTKKGGRDAR
jgi:Arc/MetJ-type ribon-helix-helix transcriptional regulator